MDEEEFLALEEFLRGQLEEIGLPDLADPRAYLMRESPGELGRLRAPREALIEMLEALHRRLAIEDRETFQKSMTIIAQSIEGPTPERALVEPLSQVEPDIDLSNSPDARELRARIRQLINTLAETPYRR